MNTKISINIDTSSIGPDRLEELVLHVINLSENDPRFASTKLNKLVFEADLEAFCKTGRTISGATYQKEKFGPVPRAMPIVLNRLLDEGRIEMIQATFNSKPAKKPRGLAPADLSAFSPRDLEVVSKIVAEKFGKSGTKMSNDTHLPIAYDAYEIGETIPFAAWLMEKGNVTPRDREIAAGLEEKARKFHEAA